MGLTTAFFAFYKTVWVGISLASIAVEAVATFQNLGEKINPVPKCRVLQDHLGWEFWPVGVVAGNPERSKISFPQNQTRRHKRARHKTQAKKGSINRIAETPQICTAALITNNPLHLIGADKRHNASRPRRKSFQHAQRLCTRML